MHVLVTILVLAAPLCHATWVKEMENPGSGFHEGDMILTPEQVKEKKDGTVSYASTVGLQWKLPIAYKLSSEIARDSSAVRQINLAIADYHRYTCLRFKKRTTESAYLYLQGGGGCSSPVGYNSWRKVNKITLGRGCRYKATIMHEIGHSIGFYHEQSRPDRDKYITINYGNIMRGMAYNFDKHTRGIDSLGTTYDYSSMMHYGATAFSKNRRNTISTKDPTKQHLIGQRRGFSPIDIKQINLLYKCNGYTPPPQTEPPCEDGHTRCQEWADRGECKINPNYMLRVCRVACKVCSGGGASTSAPDTQPPNTGAPSCVNNHERCQEWADRGECKINPKYMLRMCKKACKVCS